MQLGIGVCKEAGGRGEALLVCVEIRDVPTTRRRALATAVRVAVEQVALGFQRVTGLPLGSHLDADHDHRTDRGLAGRIEHNRADFSLVRCFVIRRIFCSRCAGSRTVLLGGHRFSGTKAKTADRNSRANGSDTDQDDCTRGQSRRFHITVHGDLQQPLDAIGHRATVEKRKPAGASGPGQDQEPPGPAGKAEKQLGVSHRVGAKRDDHLVTDQLALAIEPREHPMHQRMEKERDSHDLLHQLDPIVAMRQVRQLMQDRGPAVGK